MPDADYRSFFERYAARLMSALEDSEDIGAMCESFAPYVVGAAAGDFINGTANDETLAGMFRQNQGFYRALGLSGMEVLDVMVTPVDERHDMAKVSYRATYRKKDGSELSTDFAVTYMLQMRKDGPKIFAFVTGDEMGVYRELGLVDEDGKPL